MLYETFKIHIVWRPWEIVTGTKHGTFFLLHGKKKLPAVDKELVSVEDPINVEDASTVRFALYMRKFNIFESGLL